MIRNVISLDLETYGAHTAFPEQTVFSAPRFRWVDAPSHPLLSAAITRVLNLVPGPASASLLSRFRPGPTFVLPFVDPRPLSKSPLPSWLTADPRPTLGRLLRWLSWADTILGMNLGYDLAVLCFHFPLIRELLQRRHPLLIDLSYINFLDNPERLERSLKSIGPVIGTHIYDKTARDRFSCFVEMADYNACDTHNTVLAIAELARRISELPEPGRSLKLSPFTLATFSDTIHLTVDMTLAGVPVHRPSLTSLHARLSTRQRRCHTLADRRYSLLLANTDKSKGPKHGRTGSLTSKTAFFNRLVAEIDAYWFDPSHPRPFPVPGLPLQATSVLDHPRVSLTPKTREVSHSDGNRNFLASLLPATSPLHRALRCWDRYAAAAKLNGSYCFPLLFHSVNDHSDRSSLLVPQPGFPWSSSTPVPYLPETPPCPTSAPSPPDPPSSSASPADPTPPPLPLAPAPALSTTERADTATTPRSPSAPLLLTTNTPTSAPSSTSTTAAPTCSFPPGSPTPIAKPPGAPSSSPPAPF